MKKIILTGDSGGLGNALAKELLDSKQEDYFLIGISRKENENIECFRRLYPDRYIHINFDLCYPEKIRCLYLTELKKYGEINGLINNSAYAYDDIITNAKVENLENMFKVNVISAMMMTKYFIRNSLLHDSSGSIVNISSVSAHTGYKGLSMYASTKGALESFSKGIAREWGRRKIRSNCIAPGFMETKMSEAIHLDVKQRIYNRTAMGIPTDMKSVAKMAAFLLSDDAAAITGAVMSVDSGTI